MGGFIKMPSWYDDKGGEYATALLWGKIYKSPRVNTYRAIPHISVLLNWHKKTDLIVCQSWGDTYCSRVMASLSKGDLVLFLGTYIKSHFRNRKGEDKEIYGIKVEMAIPMELLGLTLALYSNREIQNMIFGDEPADRMESLHDYVPTDDKFEPEIEIPEDDIIVEY